LGSKESYTFRSILTKACFHPLIGGVVRGKDFLQLRESVQSHLDVKIPFKPGVEVLDFVIWNNSLAVFTSYNTLELYSLAQTSNCNSTFNQTPSALSSSPCRPPPLKTISLTAPAATAFTVGILLW
jgi:hypothetical protein